MQQAFECPFPFLFFLTDLQQFADKRHLARRKIQAFCQLFAQSDVFMRDIRLAAAQGIQLGHESRLAFLRLRLIAAGRGALITEFIEPLLVILAQGSKRFLIMRKSFGCLWQIAARFSSSSQGFRIMRSLLLACCQAGFFQLDPAGKFALALPAMLRQSLVCQQEFLLKCRLTLLLVVKFLLASSLLLTKRIRLLRKGLAGHASQPGRQHLSHINEFLTAALQPTVGHAIFHQRLQEFLLAPCLQDRLMGSFQIMIMVQQVFDISIGIRHIEHALAHEIRQGIDLLHRDRLLEKLHGLFLMKPECRRKTRA